LIFVASIPAGAAVVLYVQSDGGVYGGGTELSNLTASRQSAPVAIYRLM
jgi:hypothetical protein